MAMTISSANASEVLLHANGAERAASSACSNPGCQGSYFARRRFARVWAIDENTLLSSLAWLTS
jgi:hypothetical protein